MSAPLKYTAWQHLLDSVKRYIYILIVYFVRVICEAKGTQTQKLVKLDLTASSTIISVVILGK